MLPNGQGSLRSKRRPKTSNASLNVRRRPSLPAIASKEEAITELHNLLSGEGREIVEALIEISSCPPSQQIIRPKTVSGFRAGLVRPASVMNIEYPSKEKIESWKNAPRWLSMDEFSREWQPHESLSQKADSTTKTPDTKLETPGASSATTQRQSELKRPPSRTAFTLSSVQLIADPNWGDQAPPSQAPSALPCMLDASRRFQPPHTNPHMPFSAPFKPPSIASARSEPDRERAFRPPIAPLARDLPVGEPPAAAADRRRRPQRRAR